MSDPHQTQALIVTNRAGRLLELNLAAMALLNITTRGLDQRPRSLALFFNGDRDAIFQLQRSAGRERSAPVRASVRPLERAVRAVTLTVIETEDGCLEWAIDPDQGS